MCDAGRAGETPAHRLDRAEADNDRPAMPRPQRVLGELDVDEAYAHRPRSRAEVAGQVDGAQRQAVCTFAKTGSVPVELSAVHTEAGPGLLELNLGARPALRAADDAALTKMAVKDLAATMGLRASFLAKTAPGEEIGMVSGQRSEECWILLSARRAVICPRTGR